MFNLAFFTAILSSVTLCIYPETNPTPWSSFKERFYAHYNFVTSEEKKSFEKILHLASIDFLKEEKDEQINLKNFCNFIAKIDQTFEENNLSTTAWITNNHELLTELLAKLPLTKPLLPKEKKTNALCFVGSPLAKMYKLCQNALRFLEEQNFNIEYLIFLTSNRPPLLTTQKYYLDGTHEELGAISQCFQPPIPLQELTEHEITQYAYWTSPLGATLENMYTIHYDKKNDLFFPQIEGIYIPKLYIKAINNAEYVSFENRLTQFLCWTKGRYALPIKSISSPTNDSAQPQENNTEKTILDYLAGNITEFKEKPIILPAPNELHHVTFLSWQPRALIDHATIEAIFQTEESPLTFEVIADGLDIKEIKPNVDLILQALAEYLIKRAPAFLASLNIQKATSKTIEICQNLYYDTFLYNRLPPALRKG